MIDLVSPCLRAPRDALRHDDTGWDVLIRQARRANLLARLADDLKACDALDEVPQAPRQHLLAALRLAQRQRIAVAAEARLLAAALAEAGLPLILLKGAAYALDDLPCARGRLFGDIDILVPRERLPDAESVLRKHGWVSSPQSAYDERYYREWMHEIPPLQHLTRGTRLDVHHNILPLTTRHVPDAGELIAASQPIANPWQHDIRRLSDQDLVLHSACHLFHESEMPNGLRDLTDLARLLQKADEAFLAALHARARVFHLSRPLRYALTLSAKRLGTPCSPPIPPTPGERAVMLCFSAALRPHHATADSPWSRLARQILFLRGHALRMPPLLLGRHLLRKALLKGLDQQKTAKL